jgi:hypothetical protein
MKQTEKHETNRKANPRVVQVVQAPFHHARVYKGLSRSGSAVPPRHLSPPPQPWQPPYGAAHDAAYQQNIKLCKDSIARFEKKDVTLHRNND